MTAPRDIVETIQQLPPNHSSIRFLISIAESAFKYGGLTAKQELAYRELVETINRGDKHETAN